MLHTTGNIYKTPDDLISLLSTFKLSGKVYCVLITIGDNADKNYQGLNGNRYSDPIEVTNPYNLTNDEMKKLTWGREYEIYSSTVTI